MYSLVVKLILLLDSSTLDDVFELDKESVESLDDGRFSLFRTFYIFGKFKVEMYLTCNARMEANLEPR